MNEQFFSLIEKKTEKHPMMPKWQQKIVKFFDGFAYLNAEQFIEDHVSKLTHIGVNSINSSSDLIAKMTGETLEMIDTQLKSIIADVGDLTSKFDELDKTLKKKPGFFSSKTPSELFFEMFIGSQDNIRKKINDLNFKEHDLLSVKNNLENNIDKLVDVYVLLQRDLEFVNEAEKQLNYHNNSLIAQMYNKYALELTGIKTDLLTHQQIIFQKYAGIQILLKNVFNCHRNIKYISQVTHNVLMNIAELQQIINLTKSTISNKETDSLKKVKETLTLVTTDLKLIAAQPFSAFAN